MLRGGLLGYSSEVHLISSDCGVLKTFSPNW